MFCTKQCTQDVNGFSRTLFCSENKSDKANQSEQNRPIQTQTIELDSAEIILHRNKNKGEKRFEMARKTEGSHTD